MLSLFNREDDYSKSRLSFGFEFDLSVTLFGYKFETAFDLFDWRLSIWNVMPIGVSVWLGPLYFSVSDDTIHKLEVTEAERLLTDEVNQLRLKYRQSIETIEELRNYIKALQPPPPPKRSHHKKKPKPELPDPFERWPLPDKKSKSKNKKVK